MSEMDMCQYCESRGGGHASDCPYAKAEVGAAVEQILAEGMQPPTKRDWVEYAKSVSAVKSTNPVAPRLTTDNTARKRIAVFSGLLQYFPDALAYVAQISWAGNEKHNPGQAMHWNRAKSGDELDCVARHLLEIGTIDPDDGFWHDGKLAWRALANLQKHLEKVNNLPISPGSKA